MVILIDKAAQDIIGADFVVTWSSLSELLASMRGPKFINDDKINPSDIEKFQQSIRDQAVGQRIRKLAEQLTNQVPEMRRIEKRASRVWSDDEGELSIERYLNDDDAYWRRLKRRRRPARAIRLMAEISANGWTRDEELEARCSTIVALAIWLVEFGYEVEILGADYSTSFLEHFGNDLKHEGSELGTVVVKHASDDLDVDVLAGILCNQRFAYDILLKAIVRACPRVCHSGWGRVTSVPSRILRTLDIDVSVPRGVMSMEAARAWLMQQVKLLTLPDEI